MLSRLARKSTPTTTAFMAKRLIFNTPQQQLPSPPYTSTWVSGELLKVLKTNDAKEIENTLADLSKQGIPLKIGKLSLIKYLAATEESLTKLRAVTPFFNSSDLRNALLTAKPLNKIVLEVALEKLEKAEPSLINSCPLKDAPGREHSQKEPFYVIPPRRTF